MTPKQLQAHLDRLGLTQVGAAALLGRDSRTMRRWVAGDRAIPPEAAILVRLMLAGKISADDIVAATPDGAK